MAHHLRVGPRATRTCGSEHGHSATSFSPLCYHERQAHSLGAYRVKSGPFTRRWNAIAYEMHLPKHRPASELQQDRRVYLSWKIVVQKTHGIAGEGSRGRSKTR